MNVLCAIIALMLPVGAEPTPKRPSVSFPIYVQYVDMPVEEALKYYESITGRKVALKTPIKGTVVIAKEMANVEEYSRVIEQYLRDNFSVTVVRSKDGKSLLISYKPRTEKAQTR